MIWLPIYVPAAYQLEIISAGCYITSGAYNL